MTIIEPLNPFTQEKIGTFELENFEIQTSKVKALKDSQKAWKRRLSQG